MSFVLNPNVGGGGISSVVEDTSPQLGGDLDLNGYTIIDGFDKLAPTTSQGDIIYNNGTTNTRLAAGSNSQVLTLSGGVPSWQNASGGGGALRTPVYAKYRSTFYYHLATMFPWPLGNSSTSQTAGIASLLLSRVVFVPFCVLEDITITSLAIYVNIGVLAAEVTLGIYASDANSYNPTGNPLVTTSGLACTTSLSVVEQTGLSLALTKNTIYWAAIQANTDVTLSINTMPAGLGNNGFSMFGTNTSFPGLTATAIAKVQTNTYSSGVLPTVGTVNATNGLQQPAIAFKVQ